MQPFPPVRLVLQKIQIDVNVTSVFGMAMALEERLLSAFVWRLGRKNRAFEHSYLGMANFVGE